MLSEINTHVRIYTPYTARSSRYESWGEASARDSVVRVGTAPTRPRSVLFVDVPQTSLVIKHRICYIAIATSVYSQHAQTSERYRRSVQQLR